MPTAAPTACSWPRCPEWAVDRGRCARHRRTTSQRGYGPAHQRARTEALATLDPAAACPRCGEPLGSDPDALELDHTDDRRSYRGLSHTHCNRSARGNA